MTGQAIVLRGNALNLPLPDESVDLIVTSPPYFALRSYQDGCPTCGGVSQNTALSRNGITGSLHGGTSPSVVGKHRASTPADPECSDCNGSGKGHYEGQIGSEPTPKDFLDALIVATAEMKRVLKPSGSIFVNLGDKYAGSGGNNNSGVGRSTETVWAGAKRIGDTRKIAGIPAKSLMLLPHRYAIRCVDELGLICRQDQVWSKPNGLPESVTDRTRRSHEYWFHFTKSSRYFSAIDEIREKYTSPISEDGRFLDLYGRPQEDKTGSDSAIGHHTQSHATGRPSGFALSANPLGKLPGSVWIIPTEPLKVPAHLGIDHFAAFPTEWPRRLILGWSPSGICVECGEGRKPVVDKRVKEVRNRPNGLNVTQPLGSNHGDTTSPFWGQSVEATIIGYSCSCVPVGGYLDPLRAFDGTDSTSAIVLDPFGGTGTTALVAKTLGRIGISIDLSFDYSCLAQWRTSKYSVKAMSRTNLERQGNLL